MTSPSAGVFQIAFAGSAANKDIPQISVGDHYSWLPQEVLADLLELAKGLAPDPNAPPAQTGDELRALGDVQRDLLNIGGAIELYAQAWVADLLAGHRRERSHCRPDRSVPADAGRSDHDPR